MKRQKKHQTKLLPTHPQIYEAEILPGLKPLVEAELGRQLGKKMAILPISDRSEALAFHYNGPIADLLRLRTVIAVYLVQHFAIPRPRALLGHQHFQTLLKQIISVLNRFQPGRFRTFRFSAAGKTSAIFARLRDEIQTKTGLVYNDDQGDLLIRIRPAKLSRTGWEVLLRLSPRPLSVRSWRKHDMPGALNATIAAAMLELTQPKPTDRFCNLMSGSATLLIERLNRLPAKMAVGGDLDPIILAVARQNIQAAGLSAQIDLLNLDAVQTPFPAGSFDVICADPPWGQLVGSPQQPINLYPNFLAEAGRLAAPEARLVVLTHRISLFERTLPDFAAVWRLERALQIYQGGLHPKIYCLKH